VGARKRERGAEGERRQTEVDRERRKTERNKEKLGERESQAEAV
jgi:hypothetical protein